MPIDKQANRISEISADRQILERRHRPWHVLSADEVADSVRGDTARGLTSHEARVRLQRVGFNAMLPPKERGAVGIFFSQFASLIVVLLIVATVIAFILGEFYEGIAILVVILLNAFIGFATEWKAERTLSALQRRTIPRARVIREGRQMEIAARELVPGDLVVIDAGARIPADGRIVESNQLQVEEAALTGESQTVDKISEPIDDDHAVLAERFNMLYMGTTATAGRGKLLVTETGAATEMGRIGQLIEEVGSHESPLERKLDQLGRALIAIVLLLVAVIVGIGWAQGHSFLSMLRVGVSLAIAAVPEGLPAVATMTLAVGMQRMARRRALIRKLQAVETLGSTTVICTDKTGTLTKNEMTVRAYQLGDRRFDVTGDGYDSRGEFRSKSEKIDPLADPQLTLALQIGLLCNDATVRATQNGHAVLGDPTEAALVVAARKAGLERTELDFNLPRIAEMPFTSESRRMVTIHDAKDEARVAFIKGAPGILLENSAWEYAPQGYIPLSPERKTKLRQFNDELADGALRVLGLAFRELPDNDPFNHEQVSNDLVFVGLVGMMDALREEARGAVDVCHEAGIRVIMITGDQRPTATAIGRLLGLDQSWQNHPQKTTHGRELENLSDDQWQTVASETAVFARVTAEHKLRIVESLQQSGEIVAMTGDGVNDAPALKKADVGVAMGKKGTEVAKEASTMIITDDNFSTIVGAIEQGRIIYSNILRFIHYLFSCNLSEILTVFVAILAGWPLPLGPLQILWLNLVTDVFPAMALALEPSAPGLMNRPPRDPKKPLLTVPFLVLITWQGALLACATLGAFAVSMDWYGSTGDGLKHATTIAFMTLALAQVVHVFSARSRSRSALASHLFSNGWLWMAVTLCVSLQIASVHLPWLATILHTTPLNGSDWGLVLLLSILPLLVVETVKLAMRGVAYPRENFFPNA